MNELHNRLSAENAMRLHLLLAGLLAALQAECERTAQPPEPAVRLARRPQPIWRSIGGSRFIWRGLRRSCISRLITLPDA